MELRIYLRVLWRKWWIVLLAFLSVFVATIIFTSTQTPIYRATATFIIAPKKLSFEDTRSFVAALDTLSRRSEIAATYVEVAKSHLIRREASTALNVSNDERKSLSVDSRLLAGTTVIEITVEANNPTLARSFTVMVGDETTAYMQELCEAYDFKPLDVPSLPRSPAKPNKELTLALGAVFGLALGAGLAFLAEYLQAPTEGVTFDILDEETGVYNGCYFKHRLSAEMSRAGRNKYPLSLALMNVDQLEVIRNSLPPEARSEALRKIAVILKQYLREEDVMARLEDTVFAFLLPDLPEEEAKATMEQLQTSMAGTPIEIEKSGVKLNLSSAAGVAAYQYNGTRQDGFLAQAYRALQQAEAAGYRNVYSLSDLPLENEDSE